MTGNGSATAAQATRQQLSKVAGAKAGSSASGALEAQDQSKDRTDSRKAWRDENADYLKRVVHKLDNIKKAIARSTALNEGPERRGDLRNLADAYLSARTAHAALGTAKRQRTPKFDIERVQRAEAGYEKLVATAEDMSVEFKKKWPKGYETVGSFIRSCVWLYLLRAHATYRYTVRRLLHTATRLQHRGTDQIIHKFMSRARSTISTK